MDKLKSFRRRKHQTYLLKDPDPPKSSGPQVIGQLHSSRSEIPGDVSSRYNRGGGGGGKWWKRVDSDQEEDEDEDIRFYKRNPQEPISLISLLFFLGLSFLIVKTLNDPLPQPLLRSDARLGGNEFIEERARDDLIALTEMGVRVTGSSEADSDAPAVILGILRQIRMEARQDIHRVEYEEFRPSGAFWMKERGKDSLYLAYAGFSNVVARISRVGMNDSDPNEQSILLNCHTDTKPGAPGATDNMISCSVMLEVLRVLSQRPVPLTNSVVFLFNGGEELGLQGAHAFVKGGDDIAPDGEGHRWSKNLEVFMNLEGAGAGGREILFQTGPGKSAMIVRAYKKGAKYPFGTVLGEEAFQRGFIPSDTDFRIFRDFRDIPGFDMSFVKNGWVYHTKWDRVSEVPPGAIQNMGSNTLGILEELTQIDLSERTDGKMVFFDVLGIFFVAYSEVVGQILDTTFGAIGLLLLLVFEVKGNRAKGWGGLIKEKVLETLLLLGVTLIAWGVGIALGVTVAKIFDWSGYKSPFQSYPTLPLIIFGVPAVLGQALVFALAFRGSFERSWVGPKLFFAIVSIAFTWVSRIAFLFSGILLFHVFGWFVTKVISRISSKKRAYNSLRVVPYLILGELFPLLYMLYAITTLLDIFVPSTARSGTEMSPNQYIALLSSAGLSILVCSGLVPLISTFRKRYLLTALGFSVLILNFSIVFGWIGKIPYEEKTPMRLNIINSEVEWPMDQTRNSSAGYMLWPIDPNTEDFIDILQKTVPTLNTTQEIELDYPNCESLYCGVSHYMWPTSERIKKTFWVPKAFGLSPSIKEKVKFTWVEVPGAPDGIRRVRLTFEGPTQLSVVLSPGHDYSLESWTIGGQERPRGSLYWQGRPTHFIFFQRGETATPLEFTCDFKILKINPGGNGPLTEVKLDAFYLYGNDMMDGEFSKFLARFPSWTDIVAWSTYTSYYTIP